MKTLTVCLFVLVPLFADTSTAATQTTDAPDVKTAADASKLAKKEQKKKDFAAQEQ